MSDYADYIKSITYPVEPGEIAWTSMEVADGMAMDNQERRQTMAEKKHEETDVMPGGGRYEYVTVKKDEPKAGKDVFGAYWPWLIIAVAAGLILALILA